MRLLHLLPIFGLLLQAAPPPVPVASAQHQVLAAFDEGLPVESLPRPTVRPKDRAALEWLRANLRDGLPANPFPTRSRAHREAQALRAFLAAPPQEQDLQFQKLSLELAGTQTALWRWGQQRTRQGTLPKALREAWEDLLLRPGQALVLRGWALRHAFCFALAEADEERLTRLKDTYSEEIPDLFQPFQRAFALLGGPLPRIYLWSLPGLEALDTPLAHLGPHIHIAPLEPGAPPAPEGASWIIPATRTNFPVTQSLLEGEYLEEALRIDEQTRILGRKAYLAPSRAPFEACALVYFPIDIRLNEAGLIQSIRMGDAALAR